MAKELVYTTKHTVHITTAPGKPGDKAKGISPTPPQVKEIGPNRRVSLDPDSQVAKDLLAAKAIVLAKVENEPEVETVTTKPARKAPAKKTAAKPAAKPAAKDAAKDADSETGEGGEGGEGSEDDGDDGADLV